MKQFNFQEDYSSQIPALRMLINAGYTFLSKEETMELRYQRTGNVLLEPILKEQLAKINIVRVSSSQTEKFTQSNIDEAVLRLKEIPFDAGYTQATEYIYELLTLGTTLEQTIEGNRREYTLRYIDWKNWENNVFHISEEFSVSTTDGKKELRPDIVLFVNGIPLAVIENKREDIKDPIKEAISQHLRNQQEDRIRKLYVYAQILMSCAVGHAKYATNGTPEKFWSSWREKKYSEETISTIKNKALTSEVIHKIMAPRRISEYFSKAQAESIHQRLTDKFNLTTLDILLFSVASPERLLDLIHNFILYDKGIKKIGRYQQYFAVKKAMERILSFSPSTPTPSLGGRKGRDEDALVNYRGNFHFLGLLKEARELRQKQTPAEEILWQLLRNRKLNGLKFRRQHQIGPYIPDFYCHEKRLIVELDGKIHDTPERQKHDRKRDKYLTSLKFYILRFPNERIFNDIENVLKEIVDFQPIPPSPPEEKQNHPSSPGKENQSHTNQNHPSPPEREDQPHTNQNHPSPPGREDQPHTNQNHPSPPEREDQPHTNQNYPSPPGRGTEGEGTPSRRGGVIWHTQGSGKSLTMGFMAEAIAREESIKNPKIILVTDRTDLDKQITGTFQNIGLEVLNAKSGKNLIKILESNTDAVITTIINKFETAVKRLKEPLESPNIFVLVDEGHRTQYGSFNIEMQKTMPNACYMAFTGTPLFHKDKNTVGKFGSMIDKYTVKQAVDDGAVLPLIYEGRYSDISVNREAIDNYFDKVAEPLSKEQRVDLKKKFSGRSPILDADQNIYAIAWDISEHFSENFQGTGLKGQLVCSKKRTAVKYYHYLKQIGKVSCALVISPPDDREGEESAYGEVSDDVKKFWKSMMDQYSNSKRYEENIINQFKYDKEPEIIIVVDKLLTGFDAPLNTVLYLTRKLKGHTLLQAIARVNRLHKDKDYGYIVDYAGVVSELDDALMVYSDMDEFDFDDLEGTMVNITEEIKKLEPAHQSLLDLFKDISNKEDTEAYQQKLRPDDVRDTFYKRLTAYARILKVALSSIEFHKNTDEKKINRYKNDLKFFVNLRTAVAQRYSDKIDYKEYEGQIQKLIDQHISTKGVEQLTDLVNIFDQEAFQAEVEKTIGSAAKADKIASRTAKHINEKMDEDPAFYKKFSQLIQQCIDDFYSERISQLEYLNRIKEYSEKVLTKTDSSIPEKIRENPTVSAFYGTMFSFYKEKEAELSDKVDLLVNAALMIHEIIESRKVVNWRNDTDIIKKMGLEVGDYIYDEVREKMDVELTFSDLDNIVEQIMSIAKTRG